MQFKNEIAATKKREAVVRQALNESKKVVVKAKEVFQQAQKDFKEADNNMEKGKKISSGEISDEFSPASMQIDDVINVIFASIEQRRQQTKGNNSVPSQSLSGRKHIIILRPSMQSMMEELEKMLEFEVQNKEQKDLQETKTDDENSNLENRSSNSELDDPLYHKIRAEQLMLLALHPAAPNPTLPSIPSQLGELKSWAEPGWHLVLDVPDEKRDNILPYTYTSQTFQSAISECSSAPGRQSAALLTPKDMAHFMMPVPESVEPSFNEIGTHNQISFFMHKTY